MTKQEEIRNKLIDILDRAEFAFNADEENRPRGYVDELLTYLRSQGAVLLSAESGMIDPLIEEDKEPK